MLEDAGIQPTQLENFRAGVTKEINVIGTTVNALLKSIDRLRSEFRLKDGTSSHRFDILTLVIEHFKDS